jgi:eukaryotic-like serine/threonine-protein kinase
MPDYVALPPDDRQRLKEVFADARALPASDRQAYLSAACVGNEALRQEIESLLASDERAKSFLESPAVVWGDGPPHPASLMLEGRRLGAYQVQALLGAGGMGEVYRARDTKLQRDVALKFLPQAFTSDPARLSRFEGEARMLAALNHPNIGAIYGFEEAEGLRFLVLELVDGQTLAEKLADVSRQRSQGPGLPVHDALSIARQIAVALDVAHEKGIIHRDLKPANITITTDGMVKVLDFGIAKAAVDGSTPDFTQSPQHNVNHASDSAVMGTPGYMSPEQARGQPVDKRTDIWAFGCVLYEMLTGRVAFEGGTASGTIVAVLESNPQWDALPRGTPASIRLLLRRCLDKDAPRRVQSIAEVRRTIEHARHRWNRWQVAAIVAAALGTLAIGGVWLRGPARGSHASEWIQITKFPDSVSQPALSPDGRMVTFIRGPQTFWGPGQIYVKALPDGEPVQLTADSSDKMSPAFAPDGARIAYTTVSSQFGWDTWAVPVVGGEPRRWLDNASGLVWGGPRDVLFSEMKKGTHMGIVASDESRSDQHGVYLPANERAMAHRSYPSPNGKWVLLAEMDEDYAWMPCRVVPANGSSPGRQVGPPAAACTFGAWSPDGKWMYLTSDAGGVNHIWRQRFPDGQPEQMTFGPTAEEGIAMAPDGRSLITAVALQNVTIWLHDASGERQISSLEGSAITPRFTPDGQRLCYVIAKESPTPWVPQPAEVWVADLKSGRSESLVRGLLALSYDISADSQEVVLEVADGEGKPRLWLAPLDHRRPPRQIANVEGRQPKFGPDGDIFFRTSGTVYRVHSDGTAMRKALDEQIHSLKAVSRDGRWLIGSSPLPGNASSLLQAFPLAGGPAVQLGSVKLEWNWTPAGDSLAISAGPVGASRSYLIPLAPGEALPRLPPGGFRSEQDVAELPGARKIDVSTAVPGASPDVYAFYRGTTQRNLFRIPLH